MFIFDIETLGHLQSRCLNSDSYQQADYFVLLFVSVSAVTSCARQLPCCCRLWLLVQKFCQTLKFLRLQTKWSRSRFGVVTPYSGVLWRIVG